MVTACIIYLCMQSPSIGIKLLCQISDTTVWPHRLNGVELIDNSPNDYGDFTEEEPGFEFQVHSKDLGLGVFFWSEFIFWCSLFSLIQSCIAHFSGAPGVLRMQFGSGDPLCARTEKDMLNLHQGYLIFFMYSKCCVLADWKYRPTSTTVWGSLLLFIWGLWCL